MSYNNTTCINIKQVVKYNVKVFITYLYGKIPSQIFIILYNFRRIQISMALKHVDIFTDGACSGNPGPGGYGVLLRFGNNEKQLSGGFKETTNNRMELLAAITGLKALKEKCEVSLYTDSQYVANGINKGWAKSWRAKGWKRSGNEPALNPDLWSELLDVIALHDVQIIWVKGHAGHPENELCDRLAVEAAKKAQNSV